MQPPVVKERRAHDHFQAMRVQVPNEALAYRKRDWVLGVVLQALLAPAVGWGCKPPAWIPTPAPSWLRVVSPAR
jgi:hypothetical protein